MHQIPCVVMHQRQWPDVIKHPAFCDPAVGLQALDTRDIFLEQLIKNFNPKRIEKPSRLDSGSALPVDEAVAILQRNERGRQARQVARVKLINKKQRQLADRRNRTGVALTHEMAVTKIQSALRGMLWRRRIRAQADAVRALLVSFLCHKRTHTHTK